MKKFLVLCVSAAMLLSTAAASLAATTVNGDFRYDMYQDESAADESYAVTDLRIRVTGDLSETVKASANVQFIRGTAATYNDSSSLSGNLTDGYKLTTNTKNENINTKLDEFYVTAKYAWGTAKMGYYEYKFTPSRVELKSGGYHVWNKADALFEVNVPVAEGFVVDAVVQPYENDKANDGAYGLAVNYKAENWGAKVTYADFASDTYGDLTAFDVYYQINGDMKAFVDAVDFSENKGGKIAYDGLDPVLGFAWSKIAGTKLGASLEYAINPRYDDNDAAKFNEYIFKATYTLQNNIGLEFFQSAVAKEKNKTQLRLRYQF